MINKSKLLDRSSSLTLIITIILFVIAVFEKGMTHDLLLEAGVFLISVKLVLAAHKSELSLGKLSLQLEKIEKSLNDLNV